MIQTQLLILAQNLHHYRFSQTRLYVQNWNRNPNDCIRIWLELGKKVNWNIFPLGHVKRILNVSSFYQRMFGDNTSYIQNKCNIIWKTREIFSLIKVYNTFFIVSDCWKHSLFHPQSKKEKKMFIISLNKVHSVCILMRAFFVGVWISGWNLNENKSWSVVGTRYERNIFIFVCPRAIYFVVEISWSVYYSINLSNHFHNWIKIPQSTPAYKL